MARTRDWWRVAAPYVTVKTSTTEGMRIIGLHRGAPLPLDVAQDAIEHLSSHGLIEPLKLTMPEEQHLAEQPPGALPPADVPPAAGQVPTQPGTAVSASPSGDAGTSQAGKQPASGQGTPGGARKAAGK